MSNIIRCLGISLIIAIILGIITEYFIHILSISAIVIIGTFIFIILHFYSGKCEFCGNLGAMGIPSERLLNTRKHENHFTREEKVGSSVRINRYGEIIDETIDYGYVHYVRVTTIDTYEKTSLCKYCAYEKEDQYEVESHEDYPE